jgi:MbtH protein
MSAEQAGDVWVVVVNDEEQYSIWPADRSLPSGWRAGGHSGDREACLSYIEKVWTDMRPLSVRKALETMRVRE